MLKWFKRKKQEKKKSSGKSYYSNEEWVEHLSGTVDNAALQELRSILVRGLKPALSKYVDRELNQFVEDVTQDALLKILDNVDTFRGESKFVTWAMKIAVREGLTELRRKRWDDISIEDLKNPGNQEGEEGGEVFSDTFAADEPSPEHVTSQKLMLEKVHSIIDNILTDKQRRAITLLMIHGLPITVVAEQMDTNRNSLYKLVHDARKKIKNEFEVQGLDPEKILDEISHL